MHFLLLSVIVVLGVIDAVAGQPQDPRQWPPMWQSSWFFVRVNPFYPMNTTNSPLTSFGRFYYDWPKTRARFTHNRCPLFLPSETDFINSPCDTVFLGTDIYLVSFNTTTDTQDCCKWDNPWNATVTSPDWTIRGWSQYKGQTTRTNYKAVYFSSPLPFAWDYAVRPSNEPDYQYLPHFLDLFDTEEQPDIVTRWMLPDPVIVQECDDSVFALPSGSGIDCKKRCKMPVPFPVPAPDEVRYPHVASIQPQPPSATSFDFSASMKEASSSHHESTQQQRKKQKAHPGMYGFGPCPFAMRKKLLG